MLFRLISDEKIYNPLFSESGYISLYYPYAKVLEEFPETSYKNEKISNRKYWTNNIEEFLNLFFKENIPTPIPLFETPTDFDLCLNSDNEIVYLINERIFVQHKEYLKYFDLPNINSYDNLLLEKIIRTIDFSITFELLNEELKKYNLKLEYFLAYIWKYLDKSINSYVSNIIDAKDFLNNNKVYNILPDANYKKDELGRYCHLTYTDSLSGRLYCKEIQTLTNDNKKEFEANKGCFLIEFDFNSFEFNLLYDLLKLPKVDDAHLETLKYLEVDLPRNVGKNINYSYLYGRSIDKIVEEIKEEYNVDIDINKLKKYPLFNSNLNIKIENNHLINYFGRKIKFEKEYAILNYYIQSLAADIFFFKFNEIKNCFKQTFKDRIISQSHDSILIQLSENTISKTNTLETINNILLTPIDIFSFKINYKYGRNLFNMK